MNTLEDIKARLAAATPGPWYWRNTGEPMLMGARTRIVMTFSRMGMGSAQPEFRDKDNLLVKAGKENLYAFPDAEFIANAPTDIAHLVAALEAARSIPPLSDRENGNEMFLLGWEAAMEEVNARINEALGES